ncbi:MAG: ABC transporter substrate-binding protein [bacterium]
MQFLGRLRSLCFARAFAGWSVIPALALLLVASTCSGKPYRIAFVGSESSVTARMAVEDVNATGGIGGRTLELTTVDEKYFTPPSKAITIAERLCANDSVLAVVGHGGSGTSLVASQVYNAKGMPQIAPNSSSPLFADAGPYSFRLVASDNHQAHFIATQINAMKPMPRVAMLYVTGDYGRALSHALQHELQTAAVPLVYEAAYIEGSGFAQGASELASALAHTRPDLLVWIGRPEEFATLEPFLATLLPSLHVLGSDALGAFRELPDLKPFEGISFVSYVDLTANRPALVSVARRYRARTGHSLTDSGALTYDAIGMIAGALRAGATTREAIRRKLDEFAVKGRHYDGITGSISFDSNGDAQPSFLVFKVTNGDLHLIAK